MQQPDCIILDIGGIVNQFSCQVWNEVKYPEYTNSIVQSLINCCVQEESRAEYEIREFAAQVELHEFSDNDETMTIHPEHARAILDLGLGMLQEIARLNIYDVDGELQYEYRPEEHPLFKEILLQKIPS